MYFLKQVKRQFFNCISLAQGVEGAVSKAEATTALQDKKGIIESGSYKKQEWYSKATPDKQASYDKLIASKGTKIEGILKTMENLESEAQFKGRSSEIFKRFLKQNALSKTAQTDPEDVREQAKLTEKMEDMEAIAGEDEAALKDLQVEMDRMSFLEDLQGLDEKGKVELAKRFGKMNLIDWGRELQIDKEAGKSTTSGDIETIEGILKLMDKREFPAEEIAKLQGMENSDFLKAYPPEARLPFITTQKVQGSDLKEGSSINTTFTFDGKFNEALYAKTTAGQILPKEIGTVNADGQEYTRRGLKGEFYNAEGKRLKIHEGTELKIGKLRTAEDFAKLNVDKERFLKGVDKNDPNYDIAESAAERGMDGALAISLFKNRVPAKVDDGKVRGASIEEMFTDFGRLLGQNGLSKTEFSKETIAGDKKLQGLVVSMFALNAGKDDGTTHTVSEGGRDYKLNTWQKELHDMNLGIGIEMISGAGVGQEIVKFLASRGFRPYDSSSYRCGKNVGEALLDFGISGLPRSGRDGHTWSTIMANRPDKFRKLNVTAENAPPGAIISYKRNTGGSEPRVKYGHVEIALGGGKYYFGKVAHRAGGSRRNPPAGSYEVFMPISV